MMSVRLPLLVLLLAAVAVAAAETETSVSPFVQTVMADHATIRTKIASFRDERTEANARALVDVLTLHDRRERLLLYPISNVLFDDEFVTEMLNEHNAVLLRVNRIRASNLNNASTQHELDTVITDVIKHVKDEETNLLPTVSNFLASRPKLASVLIRKWASLTSTAAPRVTELVNAEHVTIRVLTLAFKIYSRKLRADPDNADLRAQRNKITRPLLKRLREHSACETTVLYPLVDKVVGAEATRALTADHAKMEEELTNLKDAEEGDRNYIKSIIKVLKLELKHINKERKLMTKLDSWLERNFDESQKLTNNYVKCEMTNA